MGQTHEGTKGCISWPKYLIASEGLELSFKHRSFDIQSTMAPTVSHCLLIPVGKVYDNIFGILDGSVVREVTNPAFHVKNAFFTTHAIYNYLVLCNAKWNDFTVKCSR